MLLFEEQEKLRSDHQIQIFATDIDANAIAVARAGLYPAGIAADIEPQRLARFFAADATSGGYRIHKKIRDLVIFSEQDVIRDPPFSRMDLISCRNLLIYFDSELQRRLIPLFNYALRPGGVLFLGASEGLGNFSDYYSTIDRKAKLYLRREKVPDHGRAQPARYAVPASMTAWPRQRFATQPAPSSKQPLRELTERAILKMAVPSAVLVNSRGDILYLHGRTGMFLEPASGEPGASNVLKMARDGLQGPMGIALSRCASTLKPERVFDLHLQTNGHMVSADLAVHPLTVDSELPSDVPLFLIVVEATGKAVTAVQPTEAGSGRSERNASDADFLSLRQELQEKENWLQRTIEDLETSAEELKSSNEEMQSINEELQSANEELETSKEELQSVNEELTTVNAELQTTVVDLSRANNDMNNLLAGTGIGTVFVDHQLRILRFTPAATQVVNLIATDVGRPLTHIVSNVRDYSSMASDLREVLETLVPRERTVQSLDGRWYTLRIQPYRTLENVIEGAVISFVDISEIVEARESLRAANQKLSRLAVVVRDSRDAITVHDLDGKIQAWNPAATALYGWTEREAMCLNVRDRIPADTLDWELENFEKLQAGGLVRPYRAERLARSGNRLWVTITATALVDADAHVYAIATTECRMDAGET
jgi:two-component system, chemotaxis family, CheB/CheR fusion protein